MHERGPLVTVVIVNYNYEKFVAAAIDSALGQSYAPLEVIVVEDSSKQRGTRGGLQCRMAGRARRVRAVS
jgi:GT2 family glycosyltransferase